MREREIRERETEHEIRSKRSWMWGYLRLPQDRERDGVCSCLTGEHHICPTQVPIIVVTHYCHLRGVCRKDG